MGRKRSGKPTMNDIAAAAGCSQTTVSFVLNAVPGHSIPEETRRRVAEAAVALGYAPPHAAAATPVRAPRGWGRQPQGGPKMQAKARGAGRDGGGASSFTDQVARSIAIAILSGRYPEGTTLPPDLDLSSDFGVSRTVLREAIKMLTGKGLLEARARVGTRVRRRAEWHLFDPEVLIWQAEAGLDVDFLHHLAEMRLILEPEAAALAAARRSQADVDHLFRLTERMAARNISAAAFAKADVDFHIGVSASAGNPFLSAISALIEVSLTASLRRSWPGDEPGGTTQSAAAHRKIVEAITRGDREEAKARMRDVINQGLNRYVPH